MQFTNHRRNEYWKCDTPTNTIERIKESLHGVHIDVDPFMQYRAFEYIHWCGIQSTELNLNSNGKGLHPESAVASAYSEFIERLSYPRQWASRCDFYEPSSDRERFLNYEWIEGHIHASQDELSHDHLSINELLSYQNGTRNHDTVSYIKNHELAEHWVTGFSLVQEKNILVPIRIVDWISGTNGLAAGNTVEEAVVQATCELFERHSALRILLHEQTFPTIDINSIDSPILHKIIDFYRSLKIQLVIKDCSLRGVPCMGVVTNDTNLPPDHMEHSLLFIGASFNTEEALTRCFTEAMQGRMVNPSTKSIHPRPLFSKKMKNPVKDYGPFFQYGIPRKDLSYLTEGERQAFPKSCMTGLRSEIDQIRTTCEALGTDCIVVNLTHPIIRFPVVRIITPKLLTTVSAYTDEARTRSHDILKSFFH